MVPVLASGPDALEMQSFGLCPSPTVSKTLGVQFNHLCPRALQVDPDAHPSSQLLAQVTLSLGLTQSSAF